MDMVGITSLDNAPNQKQATLAGDKVGCGIAKGVKVDLGVAFQLLASFLVISPASPNHATTCRIRPQ